MADKPLPDQVVDFAKTLAGVTALTGGLVAIAAATGAFDRMQRNYPALSAAVFSAAVAAGALALASSFVGPAAGPSRASRYVKPGLEGSALLLFLAAAVTAFVVEVGAQSDRPRPSIVASLDAKTHTVKSTVNVTAMSSGDSLQVQIQGIIADADNGPGVGTQEVLYQSRIGADGDGKLDLPVEVQYTPGRYRWISVLAWLDEQPEQCFQRSFNFKKAPGCVLIRVPGVG